MFEEYKKISTSISELSDLKLNETDPFMLEVVDQGVKYEFFIRLNNNTDKLLVFGSGAYKPSTMTLPVFQRHSWIEEFNESIIFYNDPTLYLDRLMLGWGFGDLKTHYLEKIAEIVQVIGAKIGNQTEDTYFYGSSAGGFMSLMLSSMTEGSTAIVNNPQTIFTNYHEVHVNKLMRALEITKETAVQEYEDRVNTVSSFKKYGNIPKVYYLQNATVEHDVMNHLNPFLLELKDIDESIITHNIHIELYFDHKLGHNPVGKRQTLEYIKGILAK